MRYRDGGSLGQRRFFRLAILSLWSLLLCGQAPPPLLDLPPGQPVIPSGEEGAVTPQIIRLQIKDRPLQEVLRYVQQASGIRFSLPHTLLATPITAEIEALDWPTAVRQLLRPFQTAEVWQDGNKVLRQIFILESEPVAPFPTPLPQQSPPDTAEQPEDSETANRQNAQ